MRILVVEDEKRLADSISKGLRQEGYAVDTVYDGQDGLAMASSEEYDLILLDVMLPGIDGVSLTQKLRDEEKKNTPVLMLTALSAVHNKVKGLDAGADDYLAKPFDFEELLARVRALSRRPVTALRPVLKMGGLKIDTNEKEVFLNSNKINLSKKEYFLVEYLAKNEGKTVSKEELIAHVWDYDADILPNTVEKFIGSIREKMGNKYIKTVRGFGYKLIHSKK